MWTRLEHELFTERTRDLANNCKFKGETYTISYEALRQGRILFDLAVVDLDF